MSVASRPLPLRRHRLPKATSCCIVPASTLPPTLRSVLKAVGVRVASNTQLGILHIQEPNRASIVRAVLLQCAGREHAKEWAMQKTTELDKYAARIFLQQLRYCCTNWSVVRVDGGHYGRRG